MVTVTVTVKVIVEDVEYDAGDPMEVAQFPEGGDLEDRLEESVAEAVRNALQAAEEGFVHDLSGEVTLTVSGVKASLDR